MIPKIRKLKPQIIWRDGRKWKTYKWVVESEENGCDTVVTFGDALRYWLWHCGVPPKIAFGWFKKKRND